MPVQQTFHYRVAGETACSDQRTTLRQVLKEARLDAQLSLNELSKRAGLNRMAISFIEKGERVPSLDTFFRIAAALGIAPATLLESAQAELPKTDWKKLGQSLAEQRKGASSNHGRTEHG